MATDDSNQRGGEEREPVAVLEVALPPEAAAVGSLSARERSVSQYKTGWLKEMIDHEQSASADVRRIPIYDGDMLRIGRSGSNDLVLPYPDVSRFHAVISASQTGAVLSDLSSLNGTELNGRRISNPVDLGRGDAIVVGEVKIVVHELLGASGSSTGTTAIQTQAARMRSVVVTVLVADVCSFTSMSEALPAEDMAEMLQCWFEQTAGIIQRAGGEVDKYVGDCVMALWRSDAAGAGEQAVRAVGAAREIVEATERLSAEATWPHQASWPWRCRVALNTGDALFGSIGDRGSRDVTVLGDAVNVAFRLEKIASSRRCSLLLSESTASRVSEQVELEELGTVAVDGRAETVRIFGVV